MTQLFSQNGKMKKSSKTKNQMLYNFGIPAFKSQTGFKTCRKAGDCASGCYAQQKTYTWPIVKAAYEYRLAQTLSPNFIHYAQHEINAIKRKTTKNKAKAIIRIHDSGDFYNLRYFTKWAQIATLNPSIQFYAYTKEVKMLKKQVNLPENFSLIFSFGGLEDEFIDTKKMKHARVFENLAELKKAKYTDCSQDDSLIFTTNRVGLIYHGSKAKTWTTPKTKRSKAA